MDQQERLELPGLDPRRADISVAGSVLLDTILRGLDATEITLCDLALREGLILDYIQRNQARIAKVDRVPDIRRRSVLELGERCNYWSAHTQQVARLALALFDQTAAWHGLGEREREWLELGALLHDVGMHISYERHHKHSYYLIKHGGLRGFEPHEIEVIALLGRYHRRGAPRKSDDDFRALPGPVRKAVRVLSAFTTLAEGLDRSHSQVVLGVDVIDRGSDLVLRLRAADGCGTGAVGGPPARGAAREAPGEARATRGGLGRASAGAGRSSCGRAPRPARTSEASALPRRRSAAGPDLTRRPSLRAARRAGLWG